MTARVAAVVPAAGLSRRFGSANKLLAVVHDKPLIAHVLSALASSPVAETVLVTGLDHEAVAAAAAKFSPRIVHNTAYIDGMGGSISTGIRALGPDNDGVLVVPADMPFINPDTIARLIAEFEIRACNAIVVPVTKEGEQGNPVLWPRDLFPLLAKLNGATGAKPLLAEHKSRIALLPADEREFLDVDSAESLAMAATILASIPSPRERGEG